MTAIAAVVSDGKVWVGADSAGVAYPSLEQRADAKVFVNGKTVMGFTTSFRMGQLLRWSLRVPHQDDGVEDERFMSTTFVDAIRECLKAGGYARKENEVEAGGTFVVGYRGKIWIVYNDYQVAQTLAPFAAVGCGYDLCLGALHASEDFGDNRAHPLEPEVRLRQALAAAERFSAGVRAPFLVVREP